MDDVTEARQWYAETLARRAIEALEKNNMTGFYASTQEAALKKALSLIPKGSKVGYGGSHTLDQIGIKEALRAGDCHLIDRNQPGIDDEQMDKLRRESLTADVFLMSTNALTLDGKLVNIDGYGNRLAAMIFGPPKVIIIAGTNKIVCDVEAGIRRIKDYVSPIHAKRRQRPLPCATTGYCVDCRAPERACNSLVITEGQRQKDRITVIIVGEDLGI